MGLERIYNFRLALNEKSRALFLDALGKEGRARLVSGFRSFCFASGLPRR